MVLPAVSPTCGIMYRGAKVRLGLNVAKAFIPLDPEVGREAEVDWGAATAIIAGERMTIKFFCMRSKFSGKHFVRCYPCERQQAFLDGHLHAFAFFEGIHAALVYDNLTSAVKKVCRGKGRVEQEEFIKFRAYYNFTPHFCNPDGAHEKGGVEGLVGYVRRNYLVPVPEAESLEAPNDRLLEDCLAYGEHRIRGREGTVNELFTEEQGRLLPLPAAPFSITQTTSGKVDAYATVIVDKNRYSVPTRYSGLRVRVHLSVTQVEIFHNGKNLARHLRVFGNNKVAAGPGPLPGADSAETWRLSRRPAAVAAGGRPGLPAWKNFWPGSRSTREKPRASRILSRC